jgi:1,4-alpha-glucan branching enzyme
MVKGYLSLVLHAHLPYVRHPEYTDSFEEDWFFEAITETYMPLLSIFENLREEKVDFRVTMTISPPLCEMLTDQFLVQRYINHLDKLIELAEKEVHRTQYEDAFNKNAKRYLIDFIDIKHRFIEVYNKNLVKAFASLQESGHLEIITCGATHGFLPLMQVAPKAVRAQIKLAAQNYLKHFGRRPNGIWLPECGYYPGLDEFLKEEGIKFFFTDTHGVLYAEPRPRYAIFAPVYCKTGVAAFARDVESSKQVWSAKEGYPGDYEYREFYRDIGFDLPLDYIRPYIHESGQRINTGIKYYRITGETDHKDVYSYERAMEKAASHAGNFMYNREKQVEHLAGIIDRKPIIIAPYDAELFGHWWYEGPEWIKYLCKKMHYDQDTVKMITPLEYLNMYPKNQVATPNLSSWGYKGYCDVWLEGSNDWIYRHLHKIAWRMTELANNFKQPTEIERRALNQCARELLLAQSSDWAFIMKTQTMVEYAVKRTVDHVENFNRLYEQINHHDISIGFLEKLEDKNNLFGEIDYSVYA